MTPGLLDAHAHFSDGGAERLYVLDLSYPNVKSIPDVAAAILRPFVSEANLWMVEKHGIFQSYHMFRSVLDHDLRDSLRHHRHFAYAEEFSVCYDNRAFDPRRPNRTIAFFEPMVHRLFARPRRITS